MADIDKNSIEHLAKLARIEIDPKAEDKLAKDLGGILDHFKELESLDTKNVRPMTGGTNLRNVFREDEGRSEDNSAEKDNIRSAFPERDGNLLSIPPVFE